MKACIFDLDGTLADTLESLAFAVAATLRRMKLPPITKEQCKSFVGDGAVVLLKRSIAAAGGDQEDQLKEAVEIYMKIFDRCCTYHVLPYPGIPEALQELKTRGIRLGVLSNKPHPQTLKVITKVFGPDLFDCVRGQQKGFRKKPDPQGLDYVREQLGAAREECLYVGDSEVDVQTGRNAGLKTVAVTWGFRTAEALARAGAGELIHQARELSKFV